jgi:membrane protein
MAVLSHLRTIAKASSQHEIRVRAAGLAFTSLFAIVPVMTLAYTVLSLVPQLAGTEQQLENFIFSHFVPESGQEIRTYLSAFSSQAQSLTIPGLVALLVTGYLLIKNVEQAFNHIWRQDAARRTWWSVLIYWGIILFGPMTLAALSVAATYILSFKMIFEPLGLVDLRSVALKMTPLIISALLTALAYWALPNTKVRFKNALLGGLFVSLLLLAGVKLFAVIMAYTSYQLVYGTFVSIPLFLLWLYIGWFVLLFGAEIVCHLDQMEK